MLSSWQHKTQILFVVLRMGEFTWTCVDVHMIKDNMQSSLFAA